MRVGWRELVRDDDLSLELGPLCARDRESSREASQADGAWARRDNLDRSYIRCYFEYVCVSAISLCIPGVSTPEHMC